MRRKISTLALVLGTILPLLSACSTVRAYAQSGRSSDTPFTWSGTVREGRWVYARNLNGPVRVEQGTGDKVEVRAEKRWRRGDPDDVKITVRQVGSGGGDVTLQTLGLRGQLSQPGEVQGRVQIAVLLVPAGLAGEDAL